MSLLSLLDADHCRCTAAGLGSDGLPRDQNVLEHRCCEFLTLTLFLVILIDQ